MPDRKGSKSSPYKVGYGRPPQAAQFKPGKSGNPRGRPKGPKTVGAVLRDVIQRRIEVTENGKTRRILVLEVMLRRLANDAMRSDPRAMKLLLFLIDRYGEAPEVGPHLEEMLAEDREILMHFLQQPAAPAAERDKTDENTVRRDGR
jgi:Family of unknown function (DUF5681)